MKHVDLINQAHQVFPGSTLASDTTFKALLAGEFVLIKMPSGMIVKTKVLPGGKMELPAGVDFASNSVRETWIQKALEAYRAI